METWKRSLLYILLAVLVIIALPLLFPLLIGGFIASRINSRKFKQQYSEFLYACDNVLFFCYTNRNQTQEYIEEKILPLLPSSLNIIYWEGHEVHSDYDPRFVTHMLYHTQNSGFPNLMRVTDGQVVDASLLKDFQLHLDQAGDPASFVEVVAEQVAVLSAMDMKQPEKPPKRSRSFLKRQRKSQKQD